MRANSLREQRADRCSSRSLMARRRHPAAELGVAALIWMYLCVFLFLFSHKSVPLAHCLDAHETFLFLSNVNTCVNFRPLSCITPRVERGETTCGALDELVPTLLLESPDASLLEGGNKTPALRRGVLQRLCECCSPS